MMVYHITSTAVTETFGEGMAMGFERTMGSAGAGLVGMSWLYVSLSSESEESLLVSSSSSHEMTLTVEACAVA